MKYTSLTGSKNTHTHTHTKHILVATEQRNGQLCVDLVHHVTETGFLHSFLSLSVHYLKEQYIMLLPCSACFPQVQSPHLSKERRQLQEQTEVEAGLPAPEESGKIFNPSCLLM